MGKGGEGVWEKIPVRPVLGNVEGYIRGLITLILKMGFIFVYHWHTLSMMATLIQAAAYSPK